MGKGDIKTKRGKITNKSFGVLRKAKKNNSSPTDGTKGKKALKKEMKAEVKATESKAEVKEVKKEKSPAKSTKKQTPAKEKSES